MQTLESHPYFAMVQDCKFRHLDCGKHNCWERVSRNRTRSSSRNCSLSSNSWHEIPLHGVGWRYVSRRSTQSTSANPRTSSWYWNSRKASFRKKTSSNGNVISLILFCPKKSIFNNSGFRRKARVLKCKRFCRQKGGHGPRRSMRRPWKLGTRNATLLALRDRLRCFAKNVLARITP